MPENDSELDDLASETGPLSAALRELEGLADGFGRAMTTAFKQSVVDGKRLEDVLKSLALSLSARALDRALLPIGQGIADLFGNLFSGLARATGSGQGGLAAPRVTPFAAGGIVRRPSYFPSPDAIGVMGEAGPETIRGLARGADGRLGVRGAGGGGGVAVTFNVSTRDADSFRRAEAELTAMLARAVARGQRGL